MASFAGLNVVDIVPRTTTKAMAVADEMASMGCAAETTVVFGDMPNDLPMFGWAGWACAVANGHPTVPAPSKGTNRNRADATDAGPAPGVFFPHRLLGHHQPPGHSDRGGPAHATPTCLPGDVGDDAHA